MNNGRLGGGDPSPSFVTVRDPLDKVRIVLLGLGATAQSLRSVALDLGENLLLLEYDPDLRSTLVAVGGPNSLPTAAWLSHQLQDAGCSVAEILPPQVAAPAS
jgi:hypothetical protein